MTTTAAVAYPLAELGADCPLLSGAEYRDIFLSITERNGSGFAVLDRNLRVRESNAAFARQCGDPLVHLRGRPFGDLLHPQAKPHVLHQLERLLQGRSERFVERLAVLRHSVTPSTATLTAMAVAPADGQSRTVLVLVSPDRAADERRAWPGRKKNLSAINARILEGIATGATTVQLAARLYLSRQGVEYHVSSMMREFKVPNRVALVSKAYSMGLLGVDSWPPKVNANHIDR
ncbi:PAS domain-containing protein [Micromonospora mangrovi]|uniref:PAS domain-containing protein n=2 Tax=Micromonospora TaxID=1873 RepID=A0AAU7MF72_9ACTN